MSSSRSALWTGLLVCACASAVIAACGGNAPAPEAPAGNMPAETTGPDAPGNPTMAEGTSSTPSPIPHAIEGQEDCTSCHVEAGGTPAQGAKAMPEDHTGRDNSTCQDCHQPS